MRVVMLGTGTDVGKTYVSSQLAAALREHAPVLALKPVESGLAAGRLSDADRIAQAAGHAPPLSRWRFAPPVSPHLAAREHGVELDVAVIADWVRAQELARPARFTLVETAGGAFSPLAPGVTNVDLALALEPALWILVAPDALGVLHDVTATLRALPRPPDAVVLSAARPVDASTGRNARELSLLKITTVAAVVGLGEGAKDLAHWLSARHH